MKKSWNDRFTGRSWAQLFGVLLCLLSVSAWANDAPARHALLISVGRYEASNKPLDQSIPPLYAKDEKMVDALMMKDALEAFDFKVVLLSDEDATKEGIRRAITRLQSQVKAGDVVWVYYTGHGSVVGDKVAICPYDVKRKEDSKHIDSDEILQWASDLQKRKALNVTLVLDCCFIQTEGTSMDPAHYKKALPGKIIAVSDQQRSRKAFADKLNERPVVVLTAANVGEDAIQELKGNESYGLFTKRLTDALMTMKREMEKETEEEKQPECWSYAKLMEQVSTAMRKDLAIRYPRSGIRQTPKVYGSSGRVQGPVFPAPSAPEVASGTSVISLVRSELKAGDTLTAQFTPDQDGYASYFIVTPQGEALHLPLPSEMRKVNQGVPHALNAEVIPGAAAGSYALWVFISSADPDPAMLNQMKSRCTPLGSTEGYVTVGEHIRIRVPVPTGSPSSSSAWETHSEGFLGAHTTYSVVAGN